MNYEVYDLIFFAVINQTFKRQRFCCNAGTNQRGGGIFAFLGSSFIRFVGGMSSSSSFPPSLSLLGLIKEFVAIISRAISTNGYRSKAQTGSTKYIKKKERGREGGGGKKKEVSVSNERERER